MLDQQAKDGNGKRFGKLACRAMGFDNVEFIGLKNGYIEFMAKTYFTNGEF